MLFKIFFMVKHVLPVLLLSVHFLSSAQLKYPDTKTISHKDVYHGVSVDDPYQWLEDDTSAATEAWVVEQNKVTFSYLEQIPYRDQLSNRIKELTNYPRIASFTKAGNALIYARNEGLQNQPVWYIKDQVTGVETVLINPNTLDPTGTTSVNNIGISKNKQFAAFSLSQSGSDWNVIKVMDLKSQSWMTDELKWVKFSGASWLEDGFFYSRYPQPAEGKEYSAATEYHSIYYHKLGTSQDKDILIYSDQQQPRHYHNVSLTDDKQYLILYKSTGTDGFETYYYDLRQGLENVTFKALFQGFSHKNSVIGHHNGQLYIHTDIGAPNYRIIALTPGDTDSKNWKEIIPEQKSVMESAVFAGGNIVAKFLENASSKLNIYSMDGSSVQSVPLEGIVTADILYSDAEDEELIYQFTSFTLPQKINIFNLSKRSEQTFFQPALLFNPADYVVEQKWFASKDGTQIPMFLIHRKNIVKDGNNPVYLYGYGGFNISIEPRFSPSYLSLLEQGVVIAIVNLRGGGEFGEEWHKAGMLMKKQNVFDDFIAAAERLIADRYTSSQRLAIAGRSNGGLLVGACMTQRPDLFKVALPGVGVLDMLKFQDFTVGWGWVPEYGSSQQSPEMFRYLYGYSPYHRLKKGTSYPATLITTADHDDRVVPAHSFKFAARLQAYHQGNHPVLIRIDTQAGHGAGKPVSKQIAEVADMYAFMLWNMGIQSLTQPSLWNPERGHIPKTEEK